MPQVNLKYSDSIELNVKKLFNDIETVINKRDGTAGACKSRAYPASAYLHEHVFLVVSFLRKPHRDDVFMKSLREKIESVLISYLPRGCYYSIEMSFSGEYYLTAQMD